MSKRYRCQHLTSFNIVFFRPPQKNAYVIPCLPLVEQLAELTGDDGWGRQLELFDDYQQRDQRDETLIARAALLLSDRAASGGRIEEARALAADGLRAARRERNPRLERMVTMRILELPLGESE